jgi:hypothetical protein
METRIKRVEGLLAAATTKTSAMSIVSEPPTQLEELSERLSIMFIDGDAGVSHFWGMFKSRTAFQNISSRVLV